MREEIHIVIHIELLKFSNLNEIEMAVCVWGCVLERERERERFSIVFLHRLTVCKYIEILIYINKAYFKLVIFLKDYLITYRVFLWV
jgi:hypothetical protein